MNKKVVWVIIAEILALLFLSIVELRVFFVLLLLVYLLVYLIVNKKNSIPVVLFLSLIFLYWKNILLFYYSIQIPLASQSAKIPKNNKNIRKFTLNMYKNIFTLKMNFEKMPEKPTIIISNYPCMYYEAFSIVMIPRDISVIMQDNFGTRNTWFKWLSHVIFRRKKNGNSYEEVKGDVKKALDNNRSVFGYATTHAIKNEKIYIGRVRTGLLRIAKELGVMITPIVIDSIDTSMTRILEQNFSMYVEDSFLVGDPQEDARKVERIFNKRLEVFRKEKFIFI
jgi:1-acyl-sn-glycerol-3-phosphate acyltransferase